MKKIQTKGVRSARFTSSSAALCSFLSLFAPGCDLPGKPRLADKPISANQIVDFDVLYSQNCLGCHGPDGRLGPAPPLNNAVFLSIAPDSELVRVIGEGRPGTPMPGFASSKGGNLTDMQVMILAAGIKPRWGTTDRAPDKVPPYFTAKNNSSGDKDHGAVIFDRACASCHGPLGEGNESREGGAGAINESAFLALISDQALRRYVITGRPDLGMPGYADKSGRPDNYQPMTSDEIQDLVAFLASWRR